jgi:ABC-type uncharacterized transport system permease subunit
MRQPLSFVLRSNTGMILVALLIALAINTFFILLLGGNPVEAYRTAFRVSLGTVGGIAQTFNKTTPLLLGSLAVAVGFRAGLFNIGVDGQIYLGAIFATGLGLSLAGSGIPAPLFVLILMLGGMLGGLIYALIPGLLRVIGGVNEIFTTVMLNFIALYLTEYLATGPWNDPAAGEAITLPIDPTAELAMLIPSRGAHIGVLLAALMAGVVWYLLNRTVFGYELRAVGENLRAAMLAGISTNRIILLTLMLSGALAGLAGAIEVSGVHNRLLLGLSPNYGVMAILVSVLGRNHPLLLIPVTFLFSVLLIGSDSMQRTVGFPASAVFLFQALVVLIVLWGGVYRQRLQRAA